MFTLREQREPGRSEFIGQLIARSLLGVREGERIPTVRDLAARFGASVGATQAVLARFESDGVVTFDRGRRRGVTIRTRSLGRLWEVAEGMPFVVALPLPTTPTTNGLATAIKAQLAAADVDAFLVFIRGSRRRLEDLRRGQCSAAVMSVLAARERDATDQVVVLDFPPGSFVREHRVFYIEPRDGQLPRVIVDRDSADFQTLAELEFPAGTAQFVPANFMQFRRLLHERRADVAILDVEEADGRLPEFVRDRPLSTRVQETIHGENRRAAIVAQRSRESVQKVLYEALQPEELLRIQREVVDGIRVPEY
jgi:hypothetical protein